MKVFFIAAVSVVSCIPQPVGFGEDQVAGLSGQPHHRNHHHNRQPDFQSSYPKVPQLKKPKYQHDGLNPFRQSEGSVAVGPSQAPSEGFQQEEVNSYRGLGQSVRLKTLDSVYQIIRSADPDEQPELSDMWLSQAVFQELLKDPLLIMEKFNLHDKSQEHKFDVYYLTAEQEIHAQRVISDSIGITEVVIPAHMYSLQDSTAYFTKAMKYERRPEIVVPPQKCVFCDQVIPGKFKGKDQPVYVFPDIRPAATQHLLSIPKEHIVSVHDLTKDDIGMILQMEDKCREYYNNQGIGTSEMITGFHIPNFITVNHLHMHCLIMPYLSLTKESKYREDTFPYISTENLIKTLEAGKRVEYFDNGQIVEFEEKFVQLKKARRITQGIQ